MASGLIDPTKTGNYPVILGDALLGKTPNEIFTGIKYNHKPTLSSSSAPSSARLKPSVSGKTASYDLGYTDNDEKYSFTGTRNTDDNQYVLYFDPDRKAFILDRVDSTFNMNVTRLPENNDPESLRRKYPHISSNAQSAPSKTAEKVEKTIEKVEKTTDKSQKTTENKTIPKPRAKPTTQKKEVKRKPEKKQPAQNISLSLPVPLPVQPEKEDKPKSRPAPTQQDDEEEDDDDDGGLLVEYPGANPTASRRNNFSPAFPSVRRFDEFMDRRESEGDDADGESDDEPEVDFKLPSPVNNSQPEPDAMQIDDEGGFDLEKELENAFELELGNSGQGSLDGDESEISEED